MHDGGRHWMTTINALRENDLILISKDPIKSPLKMLNAQKMTLKDMQNAFDPNKGVFL